MQCLVNTSPTSFYALCPSELFKLQTTGITTTS